VKFRAEMLLMRVWIVIGSGFCMVYGLSFVQCCCEMFE